MADEYNGEPVKRRTAAEVACGVRDPRFYRANREINWGKGPFDRRKIGTYVFTPEEHAAMEKLDAWHAEHDKKWTVDEVGFSDAIWVVKASFEVRYYQTEKAMLEYFGVNGPDPKTYKVRRYVLTPAHR